MYDVTMMSKVSMPQKIEKLLFWVINTGKNQFLRKQSWKHAIFMSFIAKYLENENSNLQVLTAYHFKYFESWGCTNPHHPPLSTPPPTIHPTLKAHPTSG